MRCDNRMFVFFGCWNEFIQESKEFVDLLFWKIGVVCGVLDFKSVGMVTFTCHDVGKRVETGVTDWDPDCVVSVFLEQLNEYAFAVETTFAPSAKGNLVDFFHVFCRLELLSVGVGCVKKLLHMSVETGTATLESALEKLDAEKAKAIIHQDFLDTDQGVFLTGIDKWAKHLSVECLRGKGPFGDGRVKFSPFFKGSLKQLESREDYEIIIQEHKINSDLKATKQKKIHFVPKQRKKQPYRA